MSRLTGTVALITGAASGIGRATAETLAKAGARVVVTDVQEERGRSVATAIGANARFVRHDVGDESQWIAVIESLRAQEGRLDTLVNNAGIAWAGSVLEMPLEAWQRQQRVNLDGVFLGIKHAVPLMRMTGGGSIVNISSVAGLKGSPRLAGYSATKGGVRLLTKSVALESARGGWNIRVNSIHPGVIDTPIWQTVPPSTLAPGANHIDASMMAAGVPGGKAGSPFDIANGVLFLASGESSYMNGSELVIDAGASA